MDKSFCCSYSSIHQAALQRHVWRFSRCRAGHLSATTILPPLLKESERDLEWLLLDLEWDIEWLPFDWERDLPPDGRLHFFWPPDLEYRVGWLLCFFLLPPSLLSSLLPPDVSLLSVLDEPLLSVFWSSVSSLLFPLEESLSPLSRLLEDMLQSLLGSSLFESDRLWSFSRKTITFLHSHPHFLLLKVCSLLQLALDALGHSHLQVSGLRTCGFEQHL